MSQRARVRGSNGKTSCGSKETDATLDEALLAVMSVIRERGREEERDSTKDDDT